MFPVISLLLLFQFFNDIVQLVKALVHTPLESLKRAFELREPFVESLKRAFELREPFVNSVNCVFELREPSVERLERVAHERPLVVEKCLEFHVHSRDALFELFRRDTHGHLRGDDDDSIVPVEDQRQPSCRSCAQIQACFEPVIGETAGWQRVCVGESPAVRG